MCSLSDLLCLACSQPSLCLHVCSICGFWHWHPYILPYCELLNHTYVLNTKYMIAICKMLLTCLPLSRFSTTSHSLSYSLSHIAGQRVISPSMSPDDLPKDVLHEVKRTLFYKGPKSPMDNPDVFKTVMSLLSGYEVDSTCTYVLCCIYV